MNTGEKDTVSKQPQPPANPKRVSGKLLWAFFVFALLLRLVYLSQIYDNPTFKYPTLDARYHDEWAQAVAQGKLTQPQAFFRAPLYPYFLGLVYYLFGHNYYASRIVQYLIGSFAVVLLVLLGVRLFGKKIALTAGLLMAAYAAVIYFEGDLLLDSLLIPLDLLLFIFLYKAKENPKPAFWLLSGFWLGFSAITRPNILIFLPVVLFWIWHSFRRRATPARQAKFAALFVLGALLPVLPVAYHNYKAEKPLVLIASQGGINFYIGNNPGSNGFAATLPGRLQTNWELADVREIAWEETGQNLSSTQLSDFWFKKGLEFWRKEPAASFKLLIKKAYLFFSRIEISNNQDIYLFWKNSALIRALPVGFWLVGPLGLLGLAFTFVNRRGRLIAIFVFIYALSVILFFVNARFRLPVLPFLTLFAAYAVFELWERLRARKTVLPYLGALALFALLVNSNLYRLQKTVTPQGYFRLGNVYLERGEWAEARRYFQLTLEADPGFRFAHLNLGALAIKQGDLKTADAELKAELQIDPQSEKALSNLSLVKRLSGLPLLAADLARRAAGAKPYFQEAYLNWALAYRDLGRPDSALAVLETGRKNCPGFLLGNFLEASFLAEAKRFGEAEGMLRALLDSLERWQPGYDPQPFFVSSRQFGENSGDLKARIYYLLGRSRGEQKDLAGAVEYFQKSLAVNPNNRDAAADLGTALDLTGRPAEALPYFRLALSGDPNNYLLYYNFGLALAKTGRLAEGRDCFRRALKLKPDFNPAAQKLSAVEALLKSAK